MTPKRGTECSHAEGPSLVEGSVCMRQTIGPMITGVKLAKASSWLRCSQGSVCMRQTTGPVMTGVELAKVSSWFRYIRSFVCRKQTTGPVMAKVELAKANSWLHYSQSFVCRKKTTGPVMTEVELAKASSWLCYSRGSVWRKQMTGCVMTGVELETPKARAWLRIWDPESTMRSSGAETHRKPEGGFRSETPRRPYSSFGFVCAMQIEIDCFVSNKLLSFLNINNSPWM
jgi:hypothetical protein